MQGHATHGAQQVPRHWQVTGADQWLCPSPLLPRLCFAAPLHILTDHRAFSLGLRGESAFGTTKLLEVIYNAAAEPLWQCCVRVRAHQSSRWHASLQHRFATSIYQLRHDQMEQGPTEPHAGHSTFLLSSRGAGGGYYQVAFDIGPTPTEHQFHWQTLVACLCQCRSLVAFLACAMGRC